MRFNTAIRDALGLPGQRLTCRDYDFPAPWKRGEMACRHECIVRLPAAYQEGGKGVSL